MCLPLPFVLFLLIPCIPPAAASLSLLPYVQLDFAYFFKLAMCRSKCAQKYGAESEVQMLDGTKFARMKLTSELHKCMNGCSPRKKAADEPSRSGMAFWNDSHSDSAKVGSSPASRIHVTCLNVRDGEAEGRLIVETSRQLHGEQFILQWKWQGGHWITASIENETVIPVDGFVSGNEYKFMITVVGANGRLGESLQSEWIKVPQEDRHSSPVDLSVSSSACAAGGVCAFLRWKRHPTDSCNYRINYRNSTMEIIRDITVDGSHFIHLSNLNFKTDYNVSIYALDGDFSRPLELAKSYFTTVSCSEVYGPGSIQCPPLPAESVGVVRLNATQAFVSWTAPPNTSTILTYEISADVLPPCEKQPPTSVYANANNTSAKLPLPVDSKSCDILIKVVTFDLLGRDAFTERILHSSSQFLPPAISRYIPSIFYLIVPLTIALFIIILLIIILRLRSSWRNKSKSKKKSRVPPTFV
ncbi:hypothetical protein WR25_26649 [Diploscapter pachys]|uniref:Fibronectin type-III domain-containing protein n=1 Tax=Diploscapter pachys TaxID=2018661 RepID=A0A2A2KHY5_9BILA|nr:hypothetical protein WR25_26649 [Diploscapter pachys]